MHVLIKFIATETKGKDMETSYDNVLVCLSKFKQIFFTCKQISITFKQIFFEWNIFFKF